MVLRIQTRKMVLFSTNGVVELDNHIQRYEIRPLLITRQKKSNKIYLNVIIKTRRQGDVFNDIHLGNGYLDMILKGMSTKRKT